MHVNLSFIYFKQVFSENMAEKDLFLNIWTYFTFLHVGKYQKELI